MLNAYRFHHQYCLHLHFHQKSKPKLAKLVGKYDPFIPGGKEREKWGDGDLIADSWMMTLHSRQKSVRHL